MTPNHAPSPAHPLNGSLFFLKLQDSKAYRVYRRAFADVAGLQLSLQPMRAGSGPAQHQVRSEQFCPLLRNGCVMPSACCTQTQLSQSLTKMANSGVCSLPCAAGFHWMAAPVRFASTSAGYLVTEPFLAKPVSSGEIPRLQAHWRRQGLDSTAIQAATRAYTTSLVLGEKEHCRTLSLLQAVATRFATLINCVLLDVGPDPPKTVKLAISLIDLNFDKFATLEEVALRCGVSEQQFLTLFEQSTGLSFANYLMRHRVEKARVALCGDDPPNPRELTAMAGCESESEFRRMFETCLGESPEACRRHKQESDRLLREWSDSENHALMVRQTLDLIHPYNPQVRQAVYSRQQAPAYRSAAG